MEEIRTLIRENSIWIPYCGCWLWTGDISGDGYPVLHFRGRKMHRVSYTVFIGPIPIGLQVLHHCDTPICVNPEHLFLGTNADNVADKVRKGRQSRLYGKRNGMFGSKRIGEGSAHHKLKEAQVREIHTLATQGLSRSKIAQNIGCCDSNVDKILHGDTWVHIYKEFHL
jgi:hypothetical protein